MRKISMSFMALLIALSLPALATSARKDEASALRKTKKGKSEIEITTGSKNARQKPLANKEPQPESKHSKMMSKLHPQTQKKMDAAIKDMKAAGVCPSITSGYRSSAQQHDIYRCSHKYHCRVRRGIFSARPPGTSLHEAGLAVDVASVANGPKRRRHLTRDGHKIVKVMQKHGFKWKYGLKDPAHFELDPKVAGYRTEKAAIAAAQRREAQQRLAEQKAAAAAQKATVVAQRREAQQRLVEKKAAKNKTSRRNS